MEIRMLIFFLYEKNKEKKIKKPTADESRGGPHNAPLVAANFKLARVTFFLFHL
jgi:hypothetical protein